MPEHENKGIEDKPIQVIGNRLKFAKSPYLLQHASQPVEWYQWGDEAFSKSKRENKPIFLSIGYSTCHWCHVMAHESFDDPAVASLLNETFVCIKVDREERPDIDLTYMAVCQAMTGSGGWPLTILMTPEKKPFFAGTYYPKKSRPGMIGLIDLLQKVKELWLYRPQEIDATADTLVSALKLTDIAVERGELNVQHLTEAFRELDHLFDTQYGGFGIAPKFPTPHQLLFLLRYWRRFKSERALSMVEKTLQKIQMGGIHDYVGGGYHRYTVDQKWRYPHFEKMIYDQALLSLAYLEAYQVTGKMEYADAVRDILTYTLDNMAAPSGGFYTAEDADSDGIEGKYYIWTVDEVQAILTEYHAQLVVRVFNMRKEGNLSPELNAGVPRGNILYLTESLLELAKRFSTTPERLAYDVEHALGQLRGARTKRNRPFKDEKILTDWNGLMIAALARGGRTLNEPKFTEAAIKCASFILTRMVKPDGRLMHSFMKDEADIVAFSDDYASLTWGLLELYESTFDPKYLRIAIAFTNDLVKFHWDEERGAFFFSANDGELLLLQKKEIHDASIPSGNSIALLNLLRLARVTSRLDFEDYGSRIMQALSRDVAKRPSLFCFLLAAVDFALGPTQEVVIAGNRDRDDTKAMLKVIRRLFLPNTVVVGTPGDATNQGLIDIAPFTREYTSINGKATAYICSNYQCKRQTSDVTELQQLLS